MRPSFQRTQTPEGALAACLVALLELDWADTPAAETGEAPAGRWEEWLAARNLQLIRADALPQAGFWIAEAGPGDHRVVMFGSPPDVVWDPARGAVADVEGVRAGWVLAALDPALATADGAAETEEIAAGMVEGLYVAPTTEAPMQSRSAVEAVPGQGLTGDRYAAGTGRFSGEGRTGQDLTLIDAEHIEALTVPLAPGDARRNVVTRGIDVEALVGREFMIGEVRCLGRRWCEPCRHLQELTTPGVLRGLVHRGGLRADILTPGTIRVGDRVADCTEVPGTGVQPT